MLGQVVSVKNMGEQETWLLDPERQGGEGGSEEAKEGSIASSAQDREEGGEGASAVLKKD